MTITEPTTATGHPLDMTTEAEVSAVRDILDGAGLLGESIRWAFFAPEEPAKSEVLAQEPGTAPDRRFRVVLLDLATGTSRDVVVSVSHERVDSVHELDPATTGQPPIIDSEFVLIEEIVNANAEWTGALRRRGLDPAMVRSVPLSAGVYDLPGEGGRRIVRSFGFHQNHPKDHAWAHPVDGLVAYVDLTRREVLQVIDHRLLPVPAEPGNFDDLEVTGPARTTLKPIEITQPEGPSFTVEGNRVQWEKWDLRIGFNEREGLTLHQISFDGRPIVYRASIAEMVVPYADPSPVRFWQNYFDCGEYMFARYADSLELGCDCVGEIHYTDAVIADDLGAPKTIRNAICMHEEDYGVLWKHSDLFTEARETRRQRRMVFSFFTPIGNYDYGFYWYLYLDGTIQCEVKATGILFTSAYPEEGNEYAREVAPGLGAPYHQHLFSARLDMTVDGTRNAVDEIEAQRVPMSEENPHGNAFRRARTRLTSEVNAQRLADNSVGRTWHIVNPEKLNRYGNPVGYALRPGGDGLPRWTAADRNVDGEDIVVWHTFGPTHFPRPEDWPVMPVDYAGFTLKPVGFFDRNPTLDVPATGGAHCSSRDDGHVD